MAFPVHMMHENVWFEKPKFDEAEDHYQLFLTNNLSAQLSEKHADKKLEKDQEDGLLSQVAQAASGAGSAIINEIAKARESIKQSLTGTVSKVSHAITADSDSHIDELKKENKQLKDLVVSLSEKVAALEIRVSKIEGSDIPAAKPAPAATQKKPADDDDDEDDFELFGSDDEEEEETEEEKRIKAERVAKYNEKKAGKKQVIAKSSILLDVKPWDDETDMAELEKCVRTITMDGLLWGASKLVPLAYGIKKLQINCVIEDDKISTDDLSDKICEFEDYVQSVDIAAFNKI